jgi:hypothetical protein
MISELVRDNETSLETQKSVAYELQMSQSLLAKTTEDKRQLEIQVLSSPPPLPRSLASWLPYACTDAPRGLSRGV